MSLDAVILYSCPCKRPVYRYVSAAEEDNFDVLSAQINAFSTIMQARGGCGRRNPMCSA